MSFKRRRSKRNNKGIEQGWGVKKRRSQLMRRNWVEMPADVMVLIFLKLGPVEILVNAQNVCSYWRRLAKEPILYRAIDFLDAECYIHNAENTHSYAIKSNKLTKLAKDVVDRSCGQLVKLSTIESFGWDRILPYVNCTNSLKSLQLRKGSCLSGNGLTDIVRGLGSVEELDISFGHFSIQLIEQIGRTCQKLTSFRLCIQTFCKKHCDEELSIMVRSLPQVRRLNLVKFLITVKGLETILDGFPLLEHLDLEHSWRDRMVQNKIILKKCATKVTSVIPPSQRVSNDSYFNR